MGSRIILGGMYTKPFDRTMPSPFKIRQRLGVGSRSRHASRASSPAPHPTSPTPPALPMSPTSLGPASPLPVISLQPSSSGLQTISSSSAASGPTSSGPHPSPIPPTLPYPTVPSPAVRVVPCENAAFTEALRRHMEILSPDEKIAFEGGYSILPEQLIAQIKSHDDTHNDASRARRCASRVQGFLKALNGYLDPVAIMAGHSPQITSLVVGGLKLIVQALSSAYHDLLEFCTGARNVFVDRDGNKRRWVSFRIFLRVTWEPFEENFNALNSRFRNNIEIMIRTAGIMEYQRLRSKDEIEAEEKDDENRRKMLLWLSELDFDKEHDTIFAKRHPDTGRWLVESPEFEDWIDAKQSSMLWCYGNLLISLHRSIVLEEISTKYALESGVGLAFVYFNYKKQDVQNPSKILSTIMKQLARQKRVLPDQLKQFYQKYYRDADFPSDEKLEAQLSELMKTFEQVYLVMDAMDELEDRKTFLPMITRLAQDFGSSINLKIFVTSRREKDIETHFNRCKVPTIQIEAAKVDADIAAFVHDQLERCDENFTEFPIDQSLKEEIKYALTSKSNGMFLWVKFQLDYIYGQPSISDVRTALSSLPNTMSETYIRILSKIDRQIPARKKIAQHALMWVVGAARPLTAEELVLAVSIKPGCRSTKDLEKYRIETVIQACENLLTVEDDIVRFYHFSVFEYLTTTTESEWGDDTGVLQNYWALINDKHAELAEICVQYLLFEESRGYEGGWYEYDEVPFASYAAYFFDHHIRRITNLPDCLAHSIGELLDSPQNLLTSLYIIRSGPHTPLVDTIDPLYLSLMLGIFDLYTRSHNLPLPHRDSTHCNDSLHFAARGGLVSAIQKLLDHGYSINARDANDRYPLDHAAEMGRSEALGFLLGKGADVNAQGGYYGNALQAAAYSGHDTIVQTLLEHGADVNAQVRRKQHER
ncbi:hypothetical protein K440DRAFT_642062 [Wilcoxina mikolae CBS 423.85]|nr:hypothetical protein K440DRAFT_642062 [Wilcoxina mikolae CBS 423.85]